MSEEEKTIESEFQKLFNILNVLDFKRNESVAIFDLMDSLAVAISEKKFKKELQSNNAGTG